MRISQFPINTTREVPTDAEVTSHRLMLRAGLIRKISAGLYTWMPVGLRVLKKVEAVVRKEMNAVGAIELLMPMVHAAELWKESGRWDAYGAELLRFKDRHERDFVLAPTHEEVITHIARGVLTSYRQLPLNYYQIQTKFRDEIRPRFGVMRAREFLMKDGYSFHLDDASLDDTYQTMFDAYHRIFSNLGLDYRAVLADTGAIGGDTSHEFHVLAEAGEDHIAFSRAGDYAANVELTPAPPPGKTRAAATQALKLVDTPGVTTIRGLVELLGVPVTQCLKALFVKGVEDKVVALFLRGDHTLNTAKAEKHPQIAAPLAFADNDEIMTSTNCPPGSLGPVQLAAPIIADANAAVMSDFISGANREGVHYTGVNWGRDTIEPEIADLRNIEDGEEGPNGCGTVWIRHGIEVGHIFKLGKKYSEAMRANVLDESGKAQTLMMGCYGIGISRIVAAAVEQSHDENGIIWPLPMAPFQVVITPLQARDSQQVMQVAEQLYNEFETMGIETLIDDRDVRPGVMFADADLLGIPHRLVIGERSLKKRQVEYKQRSCNQVEMLHLDRAVAQITARITGQPPADNAAAT